MPVQCLEGRLNSVIVAIYDEGTEKIDLRLATWDMPTDGLVDGMIIHVPSGKRLDIEEEPETH